jgi:DNA uptake protein ComE-like DNA-binding protein
MIDFFMVDVKDIQVSTTDHNFSQTVIENLADAMLASGGLIKPVILKQVGLQSYQLIDGHLEYYAALQAKAKDPRKGEMVNAFVISPDQEDLVRQQVTVLQSAYASVNQTETVTNIPANTSPQSEQPDQSQHLPNSNNLSHNLSVTSVTDYTHFQSQLDAQLEAKFSNYSQVIQNQLRQNQQDFQIALQKMQSAWEATLNHQLQQQKIEIQAQLRSLSSSPSLVVTTSAKISDPLLAVQEKSAVTKNGLSALININEVKTTEELLQLKKIYDIKGLGPKTAEKIISLKEKLGSEIQSLNQLTEAGVSISDIRKWSRYFTC